MRIKYNNRINAQPSQNLKSQATVVRGFAAALSFLRRLHHFSTTDYSAALDACYLAACPLPESDPHRLADDCFQDTPANGYAT